MITYELDLDLEPYGNSGLEKEKEKERFIERTGIHSLACKPYAPAVVYTFPPRF